MAGLPIGAVTACLPDCCPFSWFIRPSGPLAATNLALPWLQGFGSAFAFLAQREWGRGLLLKYPRVFSYGGWPATSLCISEAVL